MPNNFTGPPWGLPNAAMLPPGASGYSTGICTQQPNSEKLPHELYPYTFPPPTYQSFRPTAAIDTPAIGSSATILTLAFPDGWMGVVLKIAHTIIGPGFVQCDGSLTWKITLNGNQPVPNFGYMISEFGSTTDPSDISPGFIVKPNQTVQYSVSNVSYAAGDTKCFACLMGYWWRIQSGQIGGA